MKNVKKFLLLTCALFCVTVAYAFNESDLYGQWGIVRIEQYDRDRLVEAEDAPKEALNIACFTFNRDHSVTIFGVGSGGWRINSNKLIIYLDSDENFMDNATITIQNLNNNRLVLDFGRPNKNEREVMYLQKLR